MMVKFRMITHLMQSNGLYWLLLYLMEKVSGSRGSLFFQKRTRLEIKKRLPGFNTTRYNYKEWSDYDWSAGGEEWSDSKAWKDALIDEVLLRYIQPQKTILELGPGAGRWSEVLAKLSKKLILVDLTEESIAVCKKKLHHYSHCLFYQNDGTDLSFLDNSSIDYVWSFDVFVHISPEDTECYLKALSSILVKGGIAIIHHPAQGGLKGGFRSGMTNELFCSLLQKHNFKIVHQLDSWGKDGSFSVKEYNDMITVFNRI